MTRAEFVTLLSRVFGLTISKEQTPFSDVSSTDWFAHYVATVYQAGLVNGVSVDRFGPRDHRKIFIVYRKQIKRKKERSTT